MDNTEIFSRTPAVANLINSKKRLIANREKLDKFQRRLDLVTAKLIALKQQNDELTKIIARLMPAISNLETEEGIEKFTEEIQAYKNQQTSIAHKIDDLAEKQDRYANIVASVKSKIGKFEQAAEKAPQLQSKIGNYRTLVNRIKENTIAWTLEADLEVKKELELTITTDKTIARSMFTEITTIANAAGIPITTIKKSIPPDEIGTTQDAQTAPSYGGLQKLSAKATTDLKFVVCKIILEQNRHITPKELCELINGPDYAHLRPTAIHKSTADNKIPEQTIRQWHTKVITQGWEGLGFKRSASKSDVFKINEVPYIMWENAQLKVIVLDDNPGVFVTSDEYRNKLGKNGRRMTDQSFYERQRSNYDNPKGGYIHITPTGHIDLTKSREFNTYREETPQKYASTQNNRRTYRKGEPKKYKH